MTKESSTARSIGVLVRDKSDRTLVVRDATVGLWLLSPDDIRDIGTLEAGDSGHDETPRERIVALLNQAAGRRITEAHTGRDGRATLSWHHDEAGQNTYYAIYEHAPFAVEALHPTGLDKPIVLKPATGVGMATTVIEPGGTNGIPTAPRVGDRIEAYIDSNLTDSDDWGIDTPSDWHAMGGDNRAWAFNVTTSGRMTSRFHVWSAHVGVNAAPHRRATIDLVREFDIGEAPVQQITGNVKATLDRTAGQFTDDAAFWTAILNCTEAMSFNTYQKFMDYLFEGVDDTGSLDPFEQQRFRHAKRDKANELRKRRILPFTDTDAYRLVKAATEAFVMVNSGVMRHNSNGQASFHGSADNAYLERRGIPMPGKSLWRVYNEDYIEGKGHYAALPYLAIIRSKLPELSLRGVSPSHHRDDGYALLQQKLDNPSLLELIWSYWHEEGMQTQTMKAIARRFQNVRGPGAQDHLANMEIDGLRPLAPAIFGYIQDEQHRLTVVRRNYEYDHQYGLRLQGKAVREMRAADTRSKFIEAFHNLLRLCTVFYKQDDDTTVKADAFPVLNALKEVHLILSQGAHNQFGDLTSTARIEMMMEQWLLARPEFREFLPSRVMVAYPEPWMDRVDAMKKLQGWSDTSVLHFRNLGTFGEQILLSVRYGAWSVIYEPSQAFNWTRFWRPQVQGYVHAYRAATGVDLTTELADTQVEATMPSVLLQKRLALQQRTA